MPRRMSIPRPDPELVRGLGLFPTPDISDMLNRLYAVRPEIKCLTGPYHRVCGPACTVKVFPGDNLMVHKSLDVLEPGDVVVVDAGGSDHNAVLGDLISMKAYLSSPGSNVRPPSTRFMPPLVECVSAMRSGSPPTDSANASRAASRMRVNSA